VIWILAALVAGSCVYCAMVVVAGRKYLAVRPPPPANLEAVSILKPLHGVDEGLEQNLRTFFEQVYPNFEILFAVRDAKDPAVDLVRRLCAEYSRVPTRLVITGEPPYPNAKVWSLHLMMEQASSDLLIMSDSDIRVSRDMVRTIAAEFQDPRLGVTTCPYGAVPGKSIWSTLEAIGMNTEFLSGILVARMLEGMRFAVGPTIAARRTVIRAIGGWDRLQQYLAEDFMLGNLAAEAGHGVALSSFVIEHRIGGQRWRENFAHRIRWNRSTRRSRPAGYIGEVFTNPLPLALALWAWAPAWGPLAIAALAVRAAAALASSQWVLKDPLTRRLWWAVPFQDLLSFAFWVAGFFGNTILWRGSRYKLLRDGRFEVISR
jgi:ceramide glucosyltransferase